MSEHHQGIEEPADRAERTTRRTRPWRAILAAEAALVAMIAGVIFVPQLIGLPNPLAMGAGNHDRPFATSSSSTSKASVLDGGRLVLKNGCVYLVMTAGVRQPLMFPDNTRWNPFSRQITLDGSTVSIGDRVDLTGGLLNASVADHIPARCYYDRGVRRAFWQAAAIRPADDNHPPFATYHTIDHGGNGGMYGAAGRLVLDDGCIYLAAPDGKSRLPVMFPDHTTWNPATQQVTLWHGQTLSMGDVVTSGGQRSGASYGYSMANYIPDSCRYDMTDVLPFWSAGSMERLHVAKPNPREDRPFAIVRINWPTGGLIPKARLVLGGGCAYVETLKRKRVPLMLPDAARWDSTKRQITLNRRTMSTGEQVGITGEYVKASEAVYIPNGCHYDHTSDRAFWRVTGIYNRKSGK